MGEVLRVALCEFCGGSFCRKRVFVFVDFTTEDTEDTEKREVVLEVGETEGV